MNQDRIKILTADNQNLDTLLLYHPEYPGKRPAILVLHGWTSSKKRYIQRVAPLVEMGYVCLLFDMRGHGDSDGELKDFSRKDHLTDCLAAYDYLAKLEQVNAEDISAFGSSYGGYLASVVSGERKISHLALKAPAQYPDDSFEVPTLSLRQSMLEDYWHQNVDPSDNKAFKALSNFKGEVLFLECEKDEIIPQQTIQNYLNSMIIDPDHFVLKDSDHSSSKPEHEHDFVEALRDWFQDLREERIIETFRKKYPGKTTSERPGFFSTEFLCEVEPTSDHPEYSLAIAVIDESAPHVHHKTTETYKILEGKLIVHKDDKSYQLNEGETLVIEPGEVHWAKGHETRLECHSEPGWTMEDHVLVPDIKCLIITDDKDRCLILVDEDNNEHYSARLPLKKEIDPNILEKSELIPITTNLVVVNTHQEVSPWDLFEPFPPTEYSDYGYINFVDKSGEMTVYWPEKPQNKTIYKYWDLLSDTDKELIIQNCHKVKDE